MGKTHNNLKDKTVSTTYLGMITNQLKRQGFSDEDIIQGLDLKDNATSWNQRTDFSQMLDIWHQAIAFSKNPLLSMQSGIHVHPADFGPLGVLATHCNTVGEAWQLAYKFQYLVADGMISELIIENDVVYNRMNNHDLDSEWTRPYVEHDFISILTIGYFATANLFKNTRFTLHFRHKAAAPMSEYKKIFDADYFFEMEHDQIIFDRETLDWPLYSPDHDMFELLSNRVNQLFKKLIKQNNFPKMVEDYIEKQTLLSDLSLENCAKHFLVSPATFKRHLLEEGTSYQEICGNIKLKIAKRMLQDQNLKITYIAHALDYSSLSSFTRFFKKMTGHSPQDFRESSI